jgi:hypothetical protein
MYNAPNPENPSKALGCNNTRLKTDGYLPAGTLSFRRNRSFHPGQENPGHLLGVDNLGTSAQNVSVRECEEVISLDQSFVSADTHRLKT